MQSQLNQVTREVLDRFEFSLDELRCDGSTIVLLDDHYVIQWVNPAWERFACENRGPHVVERFKPGSSYLSGITGPLKGYYQAAFDNAMLTGEPFELDYECSSADVYREARLIAYPIVRLGLLLTHSFVVAERPHDRPAHEALEEVYRLPNGLIVQCANCRRVRRKDGSTWDWVPAWVESLPPRTSHGICRYCRGFYWGVDARARWSDLARGT